MKRTPYTIPGLELEDWLNNQIVKWETEGKEIAVYSRLAEGHIRALKSVLFNISQ
jgi:hypothetical protein